MADRHNCLEGVPPVGGEERWVDRVVGPLLPKRRAVLLSLGGGEKQRVGRWVVGTLPKWRAVSLSHDGGDKRRVGR